jgi:hypothetical protein
MSLVIGLFRVIGFDFVFFTPVTKFLICLSRHGDTNPLFSWYALIDAEIAVLF